MHDLFRRFATHIAHVMGTAYAFIFALLIILTWFVSGPIFHYSNTWQLFINTFTTIMTFLMVFIIQNTQNRDARAIHLKLDELLKAIKGARDSLVNLEEQTDQDLDNLQDEFRKLHNKYQTKNPVPKVPAQSIPPQQKS